ncbi:rCG44486 [Rattus norvegicus]|uniref:RCG44486 n=1 Tax=Rattus norvegicus TaxID=10116 RepID=A6I5S6_RAT|nr:rCG44486 [Rattus norvegicus]
MKIYLCLLPDCRYNMASCLTILPPWLPSVMDQTFKLGKNVVTRLSHHSLNLVSGSDSIEADTPVHLIYGQCRGQTQCG